MKKRQATLKDIAKSLGLSTSTVSRALNDHYAISQSTKNKVTQKAKELQYEPNIVAQSLKIRQTKTIGVVLPELIHFFFSSVIAGIEEVAYEHGYTVMVCQSNESHEKEVKDIHALLAHRVDGLLISISKKSKSIRQYTEIEARGIPLVFFDRAPKAMNSPKVIIDDFTAGKNATQHLIDKGAKNILHLASELNMKISQDRKNGYLDALKQNSIRKKTKNIFDCRDGNQEEAYATIRQTIRDGNHFDGIFAANDLMAIGAMKAVKSAGLKVPGDVSIIGFSNWDFCNMIEPTLSSINQPGKLMGRKAMETMIDLIKGKEIEENEIVLQTELIQRDSSRK